MSGLDLNDFDDSAVIAAISAKTQRLRKAFRDAEAEYREWVDGLEAITGVDFDPELKPSDGAGPPPPSEPAPSPTPPPAPPSRNRPASMADKQRQVDAVVEAARKLGGRVRKGQIWRELDLSDHQLASAIGEAVRLGRLEVVGKGAGTRYVAVESKAPVTEGPPKDRDPKPTGTQQPTIQGRILATLQMGEVTASGLSISLGVPLPEINGELGHLVRDGDIRMIKGGRYRLAA
jgi:hypothetical protein